MAPELQTTGSPVGRASWFRTYLSRPGARGSFWCGVVASAVAVGAIIGMWIAQQLFPVIVAASSVGFLFVVFAGYWLLARRQAVSLDVAIEVQTRRIQAAEAEQRLEAIWMEYEAAHGAGNAARELSALDRYVAAADCAPAAMMIKGDRSKKLREIATRIEGTHPRLALELLQRVQAMSRQDRTAHSVSVWPAVWRDLGAYGLGVGVTMAVATVVGLALVILAAIVGLFALAAAGQDNGRSRRRRW